MKPKKMMLLLAVLAMASWSFVETETPKPNLKQYDAQIVLEWNQIAYESMGENYQHSLLAARINAMTHLAIHDALNAIEPNFQTYSFRGNDELADPVAAASVAAYTILINTCANKKQMLDEKLNQALSRVKNKEGKARGITLGKQAANAILARRNRDGAELDPIAKLASNNTPGIYQAVPPFDFVFAPHWKTMQTFSLKSPEQFRCLPPPALNSSAYSKAFNEVKQDGGKSSATRTADQTSYAQFWYEFSEIGWNRVARTAVADQKLNLPDAARLMALLNMAMADSYTAGWDSKFYYNFWRPFTAIRNAEKDKNNATEPDANWEPLMPTPPVHDYPSTHSALGNAAATVLTKLIGSRPFSMTSTTAVIAGEKRSFNSFLRAADENADSRVKAGIHFRFACEAGQELGNKVGEWTVQNHLKQLK